MTTADLQGEVEEGERSLEDTHSTQVDPRQDVGVHISPAQGSKTGSSGVVV